MFLYIQRNKSGFPWTKDCYRWFPLISGHGTKKLLSMAFEIIGLATSTCNRYHSKVKNNDRKIVKCSECGLMQLKSKCHSKVMASILTITDKETMSLIIINYWWYNQATVHLEKEQSRYNFNLLKMGCQISMLAYKEMQDAVDGTALNGHQHSMLAGVH